ncbi:GntR family transcriptional regulator [Saccharopolyspora dendranthemae]|uniref:GntR family transcriptional regulator n=1 Tax=Saccharopolyspora dendranthemae TaxID=1181886 RepID=A0A561V8G5_9PSEU|nr:GntR family transcriptional regulator [Saccharopolyspora dendranthemae]TWG07906.1 GntR family transcriptional regulator [Saccharopolyspora dendranthemae]
MRPCYRGRVTAVRDRSQEPSWDPARQISVDHRSPVPLYFQVASQIEEAISSGALPVGSRLDNEIELAGNLGLSRPTIRQAIGSLVDKGLVVRKRGAGTQVVFNHVKRSLGLSSLYDDLSSIDQRPTTSVLVNEIRNPPEEAARALGLSEEDEVRHLERVRFARGEPIARMHNYLPAALISPSDEALAERGLYQLLRSAGVHLHAAQQTIGARSATDDEADLLDEPAGAALLTMQRITHDHTGTIVEYGTHVYRASRYTFDLTLRGDS